jgi:DNA polymerase-3 subunit gamma/tau
MAPELVQVPSHRLDGLADQARRLGAAGLVRGIEQLGASLTEIRHAPDPRVLLDVATVQLTSDSASTDVSALAARLDRLERQLADGVPSAAPAPAVARSAPVDPSTGRAALGGRVRQAPADAPPAASDAARTVPDATPETPPAAAPAPVAEAAPETVTADAWENSVRPALRGMPRAIYGPVAFVRSTTTVVTLAVPNAVHRGKCEEHRGAVEKALSSFAGAPVTIELIDGGDDGGGDGGDGREGTDRTQPPASAPQPARAPVDHATSGPDGDVSALVDVAPAAPLGGLPDDDDVDLDDLVDAPPESVKTPIDRLAEAFPGSELIEDVG